MMFTDVSYTHLIEKAEFYFNKVFKEIYLYTIQSMEDTWRVLTVVFHCGVFYAEKGDLETSDALLEYAISICSDNHVTYYLARAAFQLAKNALAEEKPQEQILELLQDCLLYTSSMEEVAWTLGCTRLRAFIQIVLPNVSSGIFAAFMLAFVNSFNNVPVSMFLSGPGVTMLPTSLLSYMEYNLSLIHI